MEFKVYLILRVLSKVPLLHNTVLILHVCFEDELVGVTASISVAHICKAYFFYVLHFENIMWSRQENKLPCKIITLGKKSKFCKDSLRT